MTWRWALGSTSSSSSSSSSGLLRLIDVSDVAMGIGCCDLGGRVRVLGPVDDGDVAMGE